MTDIADIAVVGFAHAPHVRRTDGTTNGVEMLMPCFARLYEDLGITTADIGFWCSGSSDYLAGRPFFADPLRRHDIAPITDGAAAIVLAADDRARELRENPAWITGFEHRIESPSLGVRDLTDSPSTRSAARAATGDNT